MGENSKISWTHHTINFVIGCSKVSEECANCYAESLDARYKYGGEEHWGKDAPRYLRIDAAMAECERLNRKAAKAGEFHRVFINSLSDTFENRDDLIPARKALFECVEECPNLIFLLLTKRPERVNLDIPPVWLTHWPLNVWMGTTFGLQKNEQRVADLLNIPAKIRFLSCEPLLGLLDLGHATPCGYYCSEDHGHIDHQFWAHGIRGGIHWVIAGGESGPNRRMMNLEWMESLHAQCKVAGVPFFCKQDSGARAGQQGCIPDEIFNTKQFPTV